MTMSASPTQFRDESPHSEQFHSNDSFSSSGSSDQPANPPRTKESPSGSFMQSLREQQRPRSPFSRSHLRSLSAASTVPAPPMTRTKSLPLYEPRQPASPSHSPVRPSSPLRLPPAARASPRRSFEDARSDFNDMQIIAEDSELSIPPRPAPTLDPSTQTTFSSAGHPLLRTNSGRRRPRSPLQSISTAYPPVPSPLSAETTFSSPSTAPSSASTMIPPSAISPSSTPPPLASPNPNRYNEAYPTSYPGSFSSGTGSGPFYANSNPGSSVSSTPTSFRSRSPSISSLETIPDSPDAEFEAQKAMEAIAKFRASAAAEYSEEERRGGLGRSASVSVKGTGRSDPKRKRWSVSGAEREADFKMETIYEDP